MITLTLPGFYESENFYANQRTQNQPLQIEHLLQYPEESLGFSLAEFYLENHFGKFYPVEPNDIYHVLTNTGMSVSDQIGLQFYLIGNGKRSINTLAIAFFGSLFYAHRFSFFLKQFKKGKNALLFHQLEFTKMLSLPLSRIRETFLIQ